MSKTEVPKKNIFSEIAIISLLGLLIPYSVTLSYFSIWGIQEFPAPSEALIFTIRTVLRILSNNLLYFVFVVSSYAISKIAKEKTIERYKTNFLAIENFKDNSKSKLIFFLKKHWGKIALLSTLLIWVHFFFISDLKFLDYGIGFFKKISAIMLLFLIMYIFYKAIDFLTAVFVTLSIIAIPILYGANELPSRGSAVVFIYFIMLLLYILFSLLTYDSNEFKNKTDTRKFSLIFLGVFFVLNVVLTQLTPTYFTVKDSKQLNRYPVYDTKEYGIRYLIWSGTNSTIFYTCDQGGYLYVEKPNSNTSYNHASTPLPQKYFCD